MEDFDKYRVNGRINIDKAMEEKSIRYNEPNKGEPEKINFGLINIRTCIKMFMKKHMKIMLN